jgi:hypothetical protein
MKKQLRRSGAVSAYTPDHLCDHVLSLGFTAVGDDEATRELVEAVEAEHRRRLRVERVPHR